eukprot:2503628-Rhodomonas_salina.1
MTPGGRGWPQEAPSHYPDSSTSWIARGSARSRMCTSISLSKKRSRSAFSLASARARQVAVIVLDLSRPLGPSPIQVICWDAGAQCLTRRTDFGPGGFRLRTYRP